MSNSHAWGLIRIALKRATSWIHRTCNIPASHHFKLNKEEKSRWIFCWCIVPLRVRLTRLSDPVPILQDSRVFLASSRSEDGPLLTYSSLPPPPIPSSLPSSTLNAEWYRLPQKRSDAYTPRFHHDFFFGITWGRGFDSHYWQELKWDRMSSFLSIPVAVEKIIQWPLEPSISKCTLNHPERSYYFGSYSASTYSCTNSWYSLYISPLLKFSIFCSNYNHQPTVTDCLTPNLTESHSTDEWQLHTSARYFHLSYALSKG